MKRSVLSLFLTMSTAFLIAGGDIEPLIDAPEANICKRDLTYVESNRNLMWQDQHYTDAEDGAYSGSYSSGKVGNQSYAKNYCTNLDYAGYADWKLPTSDELQSVHRIKGQVFGYFRDKDFWSSTPTTKGKYYVVYSADAYIYKRKRSETNYIRCVRCLESN